MRTIILSTILGMSSISMAQSLPQEQVTPIKKNQKQVRGKIFAAELKIKHHQQVQTKNVDVKKADIKEAKIEGVKQD